MGTTGGQNLGREKREGGRIVKLEMHIKAN